VTTIDYDEAQAARERQRLIAYEERTGLRRSGRTTTLAERPKQQQAAALRSHLAALATAEAARPRPAAQPARPQRRRVRLQGSQPPPARSTRSTTLADYRREAEARGCGCQGGHLAAAGQLSDRQLDVLEQLMARKLRQQGGVRFNPHLSYHDTLVRGLPL
jgi:hypothetical protein